MKKRSFIFLADIILIAVILVLAFMFQVFTKSDENLIAQINVDGKEYIRTALNEEREIDIENIKIRIEDSCIYILSSDCPDKVCERTGKIKKAGSVIACVPNKIVITIINNDKMVDGVTG